MTTANQTLSAASSAVTTSRFSAIAAGDGEDMAVLTLDERGMVCDCNRAGEALFNYRHNELVRRHVSLLLPQLAELMQNGQPDPRLHFLCHIGHRFQAVTQDGARFTSELFLNPRDNGGKCRFSLIVRPA